jgi:hypothetical protein
MKSDLQFKGLLRLWTKLKGRKEQMLNCFAAVLNFNQSLLSPFFSLRFNMTKKGGR